MCSQTPHLFKTSNPVKQCTSFYILSHWFAKDNGEDIKSIFTRRPNLNMWSSYERESSPTVLVIILHWYMGSQ